MKDENKEKKQLINELNGLRQRVVELEESFKELNKNAEDMEKESDSLSMELSISLSEIFEALKKISSGDPEVRIPEESEVELTSKLKHMVNMTARNIGEIVDQSHEFAMVLCEHFDVLHRVSKGELSARVSGESKVELLEALKKVTNETIKSIDREITVRKQMENELRESEERYRRLFETSKDGILLLDKQTGNIVNINPAVVELFGDSSEFIGKNLKDIGLLKDIGDAQVIIQKLNEVGFIFYDYVPVETKGGQIIDTEIYLINRTKLIQCNVRNITERKQAEKALKAERQRLHDVLETMPIMVCLLTPDYHVAFANRAFRDKFGESHGRHCYEYCFGKKEPCNFCEAYRVLKTGKPHHWQVITLDGASVIDVYDFPFTDVDGSPMILEIDIDITKHKQAEEEIKKRVKELEEFYDMAVGRELRMKEIKETMEDMKEEIENLKKELEKYKK